MRLRIGRFDEVRLLLGWSNGLVLMLNLDSGLILCPACPRPYGLLLLSDHRERDYP